VQHHVHQVKLFKGIETEISQLEQDVNAWLAESKAKVVNIFGNIAPQSQRVDRGETYGRQFPASDVFLAVLYEQKM
jgi:hypothetical protein